MFKNLAQKLAKNDLQNVVNQNITLPIKKETLTSKNEFLNKLSQQAIEKYERAYDIKKFTQIALSNPENTSHNELVQELLDKNIIDPLLDEKLEALADNQQFLRDLGLL